MIEPYKHLQPRIFYSDLYDRLTVDECRRHEAILRKAFETASNKEQKKAYQVCWRLTEYFIAGERYSKKDKTIAEWMARDEEKDKKVSNAIPLEGVHCLNCRSKMDLEMKDLDDSQNRKERVRFMYRCPSCQKGRAFYEDGEEYIVKPKMCPKCGSVMGSRKGGVKKDVVTTIRYCNDCGYEKAEKLDLSVKKEKPDPYYEQDQARFCLSAKEGEEFMHAMENMRELNELLDEDEEAAAKQKKLAKIRKLTVPELEKLLKPALRREGYKKLYFSPPEMGKDVIINFNIQDSKSERHQYDSERQLAMKIKKALANTNWRLMSEGVAHKLGVLSGRLRGYDVEDDLIKLVGK